MATTRKGQKGRGRKKAKKVKVFTGVKRGPEKKSIWNHSQKPSEDRTFHHAGNNVIPDFALTNNYVYFQDLAQGNPETRIGAIKLALYQKASAEMNRIAAPLNGSWRSGLRNSADGQNVWMRACEFLKRAASVERAKELKLITTFIRDQRLEGNVRLRHYKEHPEDVLKDPYNFYIAFTTYLNESLLTAKKYRKELEKIAHRMDEKRQGYQDYVEDSYLHRAAGDIHSFLNSHIGGHTVATSYTKDKTKTQSLSGYTAGWVDSIVRQIDLEGIITKTFSEHVSGDAITASLMAAIYLDLVDQFQSKFDEITAADGQQYKLTDIARNPQLRATFDKLAQQYIDAITSGEDSSGRSSVLQRALANGRADKEDRKLITDLNRIATNLQTLLGINYDPEHIKEPPPLTTKGKKSGRGSKAKEEEEPSFISLPGISISAVSKRGAAGRLYEALVGVIDPNTYKVKEGQATDLMRIIATGKSRPVPLSDAKDLLETGEKYIEQVVTKNFSSDSKRRHQTLETRITALKEGQKTAETTLEKIEDFVSEDFNFDNLFIIHESLKWYTSAETQGEDFRGFEGRTLNIMNFIAYLADLMESSKMSAGLIQSSDLLALSLNLANGAIASGSKDRVEHYFAIFMSMLMFNDYNDFVAHIGADYEKFVQGIVHAENSIYKVHLYLINGIYIPASFILDMVARNTQYFLNTEARNQNAARLGKIEEAAGTSGSVNISTSAVTSEINNWLAMRKKGRFMESEDWDTMADHAAGNIQVTFTFLKSFDKLINDLKEGASNLLPHN